MPRRRKRFVMLDSADLCEQTADLTNAEFRAYILIRAWANENGTDEDGWLHIARARLTAVAPNHRHSNSISARTVLGMCSKMSRQVRDGCVAGAWQVRERGSKWSIRIEKHEQNQASEGHTKKREKRKEKHPPSSGEATRPDGADEPDVSGFVSMLTGVVPTGIGGESWPTREAWFDHHRQILIGEAQKESGELFGPKFQGAFRARLMRFWNHKQPRPARRNGPVATPGVSKGVWQNG